MVGKGPAATAVAVAKDASRLIAKITSVRIDSFFIDITPLFLYFVLIISAVSDQSLTKTKKEGKFAFLYLGGP